MKPTRLLRWYPRAWRERYGEELLALIQDMLDEGRPAWRLRLEVAWGGLRERVHQAGQAAVKRPAAVSRWLTIFVAGSILGLAPQWFKTSPAPAWAGQARAALGALAAVAVFICAVLLAGGLAALPAVVRFGRAGGWPKIRRRVAWAAGATGPAVGGLAALFLTLPPRPAAQLNVSLAYSLGLIATTLAVVVTIGLWVCVVAATARYLELTPRVRAAELLAGSMISIAVDLVLAINIIWLSATQASVPWLVVGLATLVLASITVPRRIGRAVRKGGRLRAAASRGR